MFEMHKDDGEIRDYAKEGKKGSAGAQGDDRLVMQAENSLSHVLFVHSPLFLRRVPTHDLRATLAPLATGRNLLRTWNTA